MFTAAQVDCRRVCDKPISCVFETFKRDQILHQKERKDSVHHYLFVRIVQELKKIASPKPNFAVMSTQSGFLSYLSSVACSAQA